MYIDIRCGMRKDNWKPLALRETGGLEQGKYRTQNCPPPGPAVHRSLLLDVADAGAKKKHGCARL